MPVIYVSCPRLVPSPPTRADTCICSQGLPFLIRKHALPFALRHANQLLLTHYPSYESVSYSYTLAGRALFLPSFLLDQVIRHANQAVTVCPCASAGTIHRHVCSIITSGPKVFHLSCFMTYNRWTFSNSLSTKEMRPLFNSWDISHTLILQSRNSLIYIGICNSLWESSSYGLSGKM